ncbi:MAG: hypothetical protein D6722_28605 [Bacteroidetes bacterium]|nr:MAG: hypothetical protein D6722_28605 [Bacteroidota bacterium]
MRYTFLSTLPGETDFERFESVPRDVYPYYHRQVAQKNQYNPDYLHAAIVLVGDEQPVGRVAVYLNPYLEVEGKPAAAIGNYECIDSDEASRLLLGKALEVIAEAGMHYVIGPFNGSVWDEYRFVSSPAAPNYFLEPFNPLYYNRQFKAFGFGEAARFVSHLDQDVQSVDPKAEAQLAHFKARGLRFRSVDLDRYEAELRTMHAFCMENFKGTWLFTPVSWEAWRARYLPIKDYIDPRFVVIAEDEQGETLGIIYCLRDYLHYQDYWLVSVLLARKQDPAWAGLGRVLVHEMFARVREAGFDAIIHAFMREEDLARLKTTVMGGEHYRTYMLYGMPVPAGFRLAPEMQELVAAG